MPPSAWVARLCGLPLARIDVSVRIARALELRDPACAVVRGLIGERLRDLRCLTRASSCEGCLEASGCDYARIFDARGREPRSNGVRDCHPFWLQGIPAATKLPAGSEFQARMVVAGFAADAIAYLDVALRDALAKLGRVTTPNAAVILSAPVEVSTSTVERFVWAPPDARASDTWRIEARTPLLLRGDGSEAARLAPRVPDLAIFVRAAVRRIDILLRTFVPALPWPRFAFPSLLDAELIGADKFQTWRASRFSQRQQKRFRLHGVTGAMTVCGPGLSELAALFAASSVVGIGKATTMGFGDVGVEMVIPRQ